MKYLMLAVLFLGVLLQYIARFSVSRNKEYLIVTFVAENNGVFLVLLLFLAASIFLVLLIFLAAIAKAYSVLRKALKYLKTLLFQALGFFLYEPSKRPPSSIIEGPASFSRSLAMKHLMLAFLFLGVLRSIAHSVLRNKEALVIVNFVIDNLGALLVLHIFLVAIAKAYSVFIEALKYLKPLLFQALGFFLKQPSKGPPSSIIGGPSFAGPSSSGIEMHSLTSTTEPCKKPHQSSWELCTEAFEGPFSANSFEPSEGPSFFEPRKAPPSPIKLLPCKEASERPCLLFPIEHSSCNEASQDPSFSPTGFEPCKGSSSDRPYHEAFEGPSSSLCRDNEGCPSSSNNSCQSWKGHSSNICEPFKGPSSHKPCHEAVGGPSHINTKPEEGASFKGPCSSSSKPSLPENSKPSKGSSSLNKPLRRNEASERAFSPHSSEHSSCNEASTDPPTIQACKGPPPHSHIKPCHEAFQGPSLNMDNEASKGFPSPSNNSCEPYKAQSSNNSSNTKPCHGAFEGPSLSMDKEASKGCPSSSNVWTDCLTDREVYKSVVNNTGTVNSIIKQKKKTDAYADLLKAGSALFSNMLWKVHFSNDFKNSFPQIKLVEKKAKILNRICRISSGHHFSKYKMGCVSSTDKLHGLIEVDIVADLCLVWSVDIERDVEAVQIIKIWDIVDRQILPKLIQRLQGAFHVYSERYIDRCKIRRQSRDKELAVPERWVEDPDFVWFKPHERSTQVAGSQDQSSQSDGAYLENSNISESLLLMKFYAMSSGIAKNLLTAKNGSEVNLPFQVNTEESIIIRHYSSCFILGRSGTGKTTVLVTKLVQKEQQNEISIGGLNLSEAPPEAVSIAKKERIKQIFVTLSPLLCSDIKQQITKIQRTLSAAAGTTNAQNYSISEYELLLDGDIESKLMGTLPDTFIDVPSKHYPMVLTFHKFLMMLANSVPCPFFKDKTKSLYQRKEIDYNRFDSVYWPHLNASLTKKFDSSTVFTEIMSVIKGSVQAVKLEKGVLSKELYCSLNSSTKELSGPQKEDIYKLFVQYEKLKMEANCYDMADWVKHTYKQLCCGEYCGDKIDFVYIDEVQDFTQAQLSLFSFVCPNMKEGYIFAGDTAQTITQGVHFRFQDRRSLFYTDFKESANARVSDIAATANTCNNKEFKPKLFQLRHNFRTHMGVVKMANSIVQLLYHFFPQSIDKMAPEKSLVWGHLPALLKGGQEDLVKAWNNMGAQQVIIVRDEAQKAQLLEKIGKSGLVLTISGCKGLEFQDVLLYNFFSGSVMQNKWRVLYEYPFQTNVMKTTGNSEKKTHPTFDVNKHQLVCSELKYLYVAVTRARERLWIFEDNDDFCKPMLDYWLAHELIKIKSLDQSFVFSIKSSSTPDNWRKTGLKLFNRQHYDDAMLCFERAGDEQYVELAKAASLKQKGEKQLSTSRREAINKLREAAELFLVLKKTEVAAECFIAIGDLKKAGVLYIENCTPPKFEDAGDCFLEAKSWLEAGEAYFGGGCIKKCLDACFKGKHFENGLSFIKKWRKEHLNDDFQGKRVGYNEEIDDYLQKCAASFHQQNSIVTMMMFVNAFSSIDLKRVFLRGRNCFHELMIMEEAEENYSHAAELAEAKGDLLHAAMLLEKAGDYDNAVKKVLLLILKDALWGEKNKGWPFRTMKRPEELLQRVEFLAELAENSVRHEAQLEVQLIFEEPRNLQDVRYLIAQAQTISSTRSKFFTTWKALDAFLRILKEPKLGPEDRNAMLVQTLSLWIDWQDIVLRCKKVVLGQDHLQKVIPESAQDDYIREFCYEIFGVTQGEDPKVCFVHNIPAYWFESHKKGMPPIKISMKEFAKLSAKFWNEKLLEKEKAITEVCDLPTQFLVLLWPQVRKTEEMYHIQKLRGATTIVAILDKIADQIISNPEAICTLEATGRLQLIFPFLSQTWKEQNASRCKTKLVFWKNAVAFNSKNQRLSMEDYVVECGKQLIKVFYLDWENIQDYISPTVFIALLERVIVMACACKTQLHEMYLPMTLAVDVMCGKAQEVLYQDIMSYNDLAEESLDLLIASIIKVAFQLLKKTTDIEKWIKHAQGDPNTDLHPLVLRLTMLLFTICLNSKDVKLKEFIMGKLQKMFAYQAPELQQLPQSYTRKCRRAFFLISAVGAANDKSLKGLKRAFAKALKSIGDGLVMTVRCKKAPSCKPKDGISTIELDCETDISMKLQALASVYAFSETQNRYQMPASFVQGCETEAAAQNVSIEEDEYNKYMDQTASFVQGCETEAAAQNVSTEEDEYNKYMDQTAFPLKVSVEKDLHRLTSAISSLASVVTSLSHHKEGLEQEIHYLDPSHSKHNEYNLQWLKERVDQVQETSNAMHKFEKEVKWLKDHEEGQNQINIRSFANEENSSTNATGNNEVNQESTTFEGVAANNEVDEESTTFDSAKGAAANQTYTRKNRRGRRSHKKKRT